MTTRRRFIATSAFLAASLASYRPAFAQAKKEAPKQADVLLVQSSKGMTFDRATNKLTLTGVSPVTVFFTDRPERIAGNMRTAAFIPFWSQGADSFKADPPNADISVLEGNTLRQIVAVLQDPVLEGDNLSYTVRVLQGEMPPRGDDVSVFIDIIGMPLTPSRLQAQGGAPGGGRSGTADDDMLWECRDRRVEVPFGRQKNVGHIVDGDIEWAKSSSEINML